MKIFRLFPIFVQSLFINLNVYACPMCFQGQSNKDVVSAYLSTTAFLLILPFAFIGGIIFYIYKKKKDKKKAINNNGPLV